MKSNLITLFVSRLQKLSINVELSGNYPWIYLDRVNGMKVKGKFMANHGFTAFVLSKDGVVKFSNKREVFKKIRQELQKEQQ